MIGRDIDLSSALLEEQSDFLKIQIRKSQIPNTGNGLFAKKKINTGELICQFYGSLISSKICNDPPFQMEDKMVLLNEIISVISRSPATLANDIVQYIPQEYLIKDPNGKLTVDQAKIEKLKKNDRFPDQKGCWRNARIGIVPKDKAFVIAIMDINPGEEIYVNYGFFYWKFFLDKELEMRVKASKEKID